MDFTGLREKGAAILTPLIHTKKIMFTVTIRDIQKFNVSAFTFLAAFQGNQCTQ